MIINFQSPDFFDTMVIYSEEVVVQTPATPQPFVETHLLAGSPTTQAIIIGGSSDENSAG